MTGFEEINSKLTVYKRDRYKRLLPNGVQRAGIARTKYNRDNSETIMFVIRYPICHYQNGLIISER